jgi:large subunit ribosomal protein L25
MLSISAKKREGNERKAGELLGVLYGPKVKVQSVALDLKEFKKLFKTTGTSSLISLTVDDKKFSVLIHEIQHDPMSGEFIHVDFYQPILTEAVEVEVPLVFEGAAPAVHDLAGTLVKGFQELKVSALPESLPHEIKVNVEQLKTFEDIIYVKDIVLPKGVEIVNDPEAIVASVLPPQKVEEELEKPIEENVEGVEQVAKEGGEESASEEGAEEEKN